MQSRVSLKEGRTEETHRQEGGNGARTEAEAGGSRTSRNAATSRCRGEDGLSQELRRSAACWTSALFSRALLCSAPGTPSASNGTFQL